MSFTGKVVIVTGASSGIGEATAIEFAKEGANVVANGRSEERLRKAVEKCREVAATDAKVLEVVADISTEEGRKKLIEDTVAEFGRIDVLVNNAGISGATDIEEAASIDKYDSITATNVRAIVALTQLAVPYLIQVKGAIVNVSSVASTKAHKGFYAYCMSKAAIDMFTKCLAIDLGPKGVRVNAVNPAVIWTGIFETGLGFGEEQMKGLEVECQRNYPLGRGGQPKEVADAIVYLASNKASFISGALLPIDGGSMYTSAGCQAIEM